MKIFNCHTHIGDAFIHIDKSKKWSVEELVAPPHGIKHLLLKKASEEEIMNGMEKAMKIMKSCGTTHFCDFREGGIKGVELIKKVLNEINAIILGRPVEHIYDKEEIDGILKISNGIGVSSISDWDFWELRKVAEHVHKKKKIFALHASEVVREDINAILDLKPTFVVHMSKANDSDLEIIANEKIPVVVCPRSNAFFGIKTNVKGMLGKGVKLMLGTDNAMITPPNIIEEVTYLVKNFNVNLKDAWSMITRIPEETFKL